LFRSTTAEERRNGYVLLPERYVGTERAEDDCEAGKAVQGVYEAEGGDPGQLEGTGL